MVSLLYIKLQGVFVSYQSLSMLTRKESKTYRVNTSNYNVFYIKFISLSDDNILNEAFNEITKSLPLRIFLVISSRPCIYPLNFYLQNSRYVYSLPKATSTFKHLL